MSLVIAQIIPTKDVDIWWESLRPYYAKAIAKGNGDISLDNTLHGLHEGSRYAVALLENGSIIGACSFHNSVAQDGKKVILYGLLATDNGRFKDVVRKLEEVCVMLVKWLGADGMQAKGRKGWSRALKQYGCYETHDGHVRKDY
jgi:hypothetical protein